MHAHLSPPHLSIACTLFVIYLRFYLLLRFEERNSSFFVEFVSPPPSRPSAHDAPQSQSQRRMQIQILPPHEARSIQYPMRRVAPVPSPSIPICEKYLNLRAWVTPLDDVPHGPPPLPPCPLIPSSSHSLFQPLHLRRYF